VDVDQFRYPGPRPQSRETALLMLADGCQARARAELPQDEEEILNLIRKTILFCQQEGQLDDTTLTLRDLNLITESFLKTLQNTYHPRIRYPELNKLNLPCWKRLLWQPCASRRWNQSRIFPSSSKKMSGCIN
jgi:cyclic-di-AMP phosphodiesterase PgpH